MFIPKKFIFALLFLGLAFSSFVGCYYAQTRILSKERSISNVPNFAIENYIHINAKKDAQIKRRELIKLIWNKKVCPKV